MQNSADVPDPVAAISGSLEQAVVRLPLPVVLADTQLRIRWQNDAARELLGDARSKPLTSFLLEGVDGAALHLRRPTVAPGTLVVRGRLLPAELASAPLERDGRPVGYVVTLHVGEPAAPRPRLTRRQAEVLELLAHGVSTQEIASRLGVADATARNHVRLLLNELGVHTRIEAVAAAWRNGWMQRRTKS